MRDYIPKLRRDIEIIPTFYQGEKALLVKDSLGLIREPFLIYGEMLPFLGLIDGKRNLSDIQLDLIRIGKGTFISAEEVEKILTKLDSVFMLESEGFFREKKKILDSYSLRPKRAAFHAGRSYPEDPDELRSFLESFFIEEEEGSLSGSEVAALVAPHIDLDIGKRVYGRAYQAIKDTYPSTVLLLGTAHSLYDSLLSLTEKDYETPLGTLRTDKHWVRRLRMAAGGVAASDDIAHRSEHSLEFQLLFLQHLFGSYFSVVPVLCGPFHSDLQKVSRPKDIPGMERFLDELRTFLEEQDSILVIAGIDLSHVGPKFGHDRRASSLKQEAMNHDKVLLSAVCEGDVKKFWEEARRVNNRYNVCGLSCLAVLMEIYHQKKGSLLDYEFWEEEATQSAVSFAAVTIER
jgi:hypothetical protein